MLNNLTRLVFVLDRSGSMSGLEKETIGGFNKLLQEQQEVEGKALVTTILFDDQYEVLHDSVYINSVPMLTDKEYKVRGCTALLDAIGNTIQKIKGAGDIKKPDKVLFVIITDGYENASKEYTYKKIKRMIKHHTELERWEFIFIGANIDAIGEAEKIGITAERSASYYADEVGIALNFMSVSAASRAIRTGKDIGKNWKENIEEYLRKKGK